MTIDFSLIGLTMLHNLWQGGVVFLVVLAGMRLKKSPVKRVPLIFGALCFVLISGVVTLGYFHSEAYTERNQHTTGDSVFSGGRIDSPSSQITSVEYVGSDFMAGNRFIRDNESLFLPSGFQNRLFRFLGQLWLAGACLFLIILLYREFSSHGLKGDEIKSGKWRDIADKVEEELHAGKVLLFISDRIISPCTAGLFRAFILIPASAVSGWEEETVRTVLVHEYYHIVMNDALFSFLESFIGAILFFNPFAFYLRKELKKQREYRCDHFSSVYLGSRENYSRQLLKFAETTAWRKPLLKAAAVSLADSKSILKERINRILGKNDKNPVIRGFIGSFVLTLSLIGFLAVSCSGVSQGIDAINHQKTVELMRAFREKIDINYPQSVFDIHLTLQLEEGEIPPAGGVIRSGDHPLFYPRNNQILWEEKANGLWEFRGSLEKSAAFFIEIIDSRWAPYYSEEYYADSEKNEITVPVDIKLSRENPSVLRVLDEKGNPLSGREFKLHFFLSRYQYGGLHHRTPLSGFLDENGEFSFYRGTEFTNEASLIVAGPAFDNFDGQIQLEDKTEIIWKANKRYRSRLVNTVSGEPYRNCILGQSVTASEWYPLFPGNKTDADGWFEYVIPEGQDSLDLYFRESSDGAPVGFTVRKKNNGKDLFIDPYPVDISIKADREVLSQIQWYLHFKPDETGGTFYPVNPSDPEEGEDGFFHYHFNLPFSADFLELEWYDPENWFGSFPIARIDLSRPMIKPLMVNISDNLYPIQLEFHAPEGFPDVSGKLEVGTDFLEEGIMLSSVEYEFVEGKIEGYLYAPTGKMEIVNAELDGYAFDPVIIDLKKDSGRHSFNVQPSGVVYGEISYADGSIPDYIDAHIFKSIGMALTKSSAQFKYRNGLYRMSNLIPGQKYQINIPNGYAEIFQYQFTLDSEDMAVEKKLELPRYQDVVLSFFGSGGEPVEIDELTIHYETKEGRGIHTYGVYNSENTLFNIDREFIRSMEFHYEYEGKYYRFAIYDSLLENDRVELEVPDKGNIDRLVTNDDGYSWFMLDPEKWVSP